VARIEELPAGLDWAAFAARCSRAGGGTIWKPWLRTSGTRKLPGETVDGEPAAEAVEAGEDEGGSTS
jgi:hypothetical protein